MYDPFLERRLDIPPQIRNLKEWQADRDARTSGLWAYDRGDYTKAVKKWGEAIRKKPRERGTSTFRARSRGCTCSRPIVPSPTSRR